MLYVKASVQFWDHGKIQSNSATLTLRFLSFIYLGKKNPKLIDHFLCTGNTTVYKTEKVLALMEIIFQLGKMDSK